MQRQTYVMFLLFLLLCGFVFASKTKLIPVDVSFHRTLKGLDYDSSGHTGFAKDIGSSTVNFKTNDITILGDMLCDGEFNVTSSQTLIPPNNSSFTLLGLYEKNWNSLTNIPTNPTDLGITEEYLETTTLQSHINNPLAHGEIASGDEFISHVGTNTTHGVSKLLGFENLSQHDDVRPWNSTGMVWFQATSSWGIPIKDSPAYTIHNGKLYQSCGIFDTTKMADVWSVSEQFYCNNLIATITNPDFYPRSNHTMESFLGNLWIIGGFTSNMTIFPPHSFKSTDGINWTKVETPYQIFGHRSCVYDNKMWIIGGVDGSSAYSSVVMYTDDGNTWNVATTTIPFTPRYKHGLVVYDNKMWIIGGAIASYPYTVDDVWNSTNGVNWTLVASNTGIVGRDSMGMCVYGGKIYLSGGHIGVSPYIYSDIHYSTDGIRWQGSSANQSFGLTNGYRYQHYMTPFNKRLYIFEGISNVNMNDVWHSEK